MGRYVTRSYLKLRLNQAYVNAEFCSFCDKCSFCIKRLKFENELRLKSFNLKNANVKKLFFLDSGKSVTLIPIKLVN